MACASFKEMVNCKGLISKRGKAWGEYRGYIISVIDTRDEKILTVTTKLVDPNDKDAIEQFILKQKEDGINIKNHKLEDEVGLSIGIETNREDYVMMERLLDPLIDLLESLSAQGADVCTSCGQPIYNDGSMVVINDVAAMMHDACIERHNAEVDKNFREESAKGNFFTGFLGALVGGVVGNIPVIIVSALGWYSWWLSVLVGGAAWLGYGIFKGKRTRPMIFIVAIAALLSAVLVTLVLSSINVLSDEIIGNIMGSTAFSVLGLIPIIRAMITETSPDNGKILPVK